MLEKLPKKITPCHIKDAIIELRFETSMPPDAIFGVIYQEIKDDFPKLENLPITQLPEQMRKDINLLYKAYYKLTNKNFVFRVGPKMIAVSNIEEYAGWNNFSKKFYKCYSKIEKLKIIDKIVRLGMRYIDFYEFDIFDKVNLNINKENQPLQSNDIFIRTLLERGRFKQTLQVSNNAEMQLKLGLKKGSVIDIDTYIENSNIKNNMKELIEKGHIAQKELFFSLLKPEFLQELNPEY